MKITIVKQQPKKRRVYQTSNSVALNGSNKNKKIFIHLGPFSFSPAIPFYYAGWRIFDDDDDDGL